MDAQKPSLAIIGGGATGVAAFIAAVRRQLAQTIYIVDPKPVGPGIAYSNSDDDILCNTSAGAMSVMTDKPLDFFEYLISRGRSVTPETFVPRSWVGQYLAQRFDEYRRIARLNGIEVVNVALPCRSVRIAAHRRYVLRFGGVGAPQALTVTDVVFCTGFGKARVPEILKPYQHHSNFIVSPYPESAMLARIRPNSRVLVVGSRLSAIDATILLCREGHHVTMVSSSGRIPAVRSRFLRSKAAAFDPDGMASILTQCDPRASGACPVGLKRTYMKYFARAVASHTGLPWQTQFSRSNSYRDRLREEIAIAESGNSLWQDLVVNFVDVINEVHLRCRRPFEGMFHPDFQTTLYRYLAAIALPNARKLLMHMDQGALVLKQGEIQDVAVAETGPRPWLVNWGQGFQRFDAIVCATGFHAPNCVVNAEGELEIDTDGGHRKDAVGISPLLNLQDPRFAKMESIWFVGPIVQRRLGIPNSLVVVAPLAERVVANLDMLLQASQADRVELLNQCREF
jgi:hypothetical protein